MYLVEGGSELRGLQREAGGHGRCAKLNSRIANFRSVREPFCGWEPEWASALKVTRKSAIHVTAPIFLPSVFLVLRWASERWLFPVCWGSGISQSAHHFFSCSVAPPVIRCQTV